MAVQDFFAAKDTFDTGSGQAVIYRLSALEKQGYDIARLPFSIRILLEAALRQACLLYTSPQLRHRPDAGALSALCHK